MTFHDISQHPNISFRYGGDDSERFLNKWEREEHHDDSVTHVAYRDPSTGLEVRGQLRTLSGFNAVDWMVEIENKGTEDTPIIENILPLDIRVTVQQHENVYLHHAKGSLCHADDFIPRTSQIKPGNVETLAPQGGRSSNGVLPFMNLQRKGGGTVLAIGWSGQWKAEFKRDNESLHLTAGMEQTHLLLHPGEKIRTPRILLLNWEGDDADTGNNLLRQLLIAHYLPRLNGELVTPPTAQCLQGYYYLTGDAGEEFEMRALPRVAEVGADVYWLDACWYGDRQEWWDCVGSWVVNKERFPGGLRPISDAAREAGMKFLLWFEPERVREHAMLNKEHPEFLLKKEGDPDNLLFDMGNPAAYRHLTDLISNCIAEHGVDIYRQDFNFDPLPYWQQADEPDRIGMTEIRYIEGFYAFWDELRERHPSIWIDNCSSGGRRIDLETMSRSLPLWPSDFPDACGIPYGMGLHVGDQCINAGLARWIPFFGGGVWNFTPYGTRSEIIGGFTFGFHIDHDDFAPNMPSSSVGFKDVAAKGKTLLDDEFPMDSAKAAIAEWRSIREFFTGDFHLLLPLTASCHDWCAWQFHREDLNAGIAMFFRRHRSPFPTMEAAIKRIDPDADYEVSLSPGYEEGEKKRMKGRDLAHMTITTSEEPASVLLRYRCASVVSQAWSPLRQREPQFNCR